MLSASPSASASSLAAVAHRRPRWTSPRATPSLPTTTMLSTLSSLHPQPRTKTLTSARRWRSKACVSAHSRTVPLPPTSRCRAAATAAASVLLPPRCRRCAVRRRRASRYLCRHAPAMLPPTSRCRHRRSLRAAATALPPSRCAPPPRPRHAAANVALSHCRHRRSLHAAATALPPLRCAPPPCFALPPPPCHQRTVAKLPPTSRLPLLIVIIQYSIYVIMNEVMY